MTNSLQHQSWTLNWGSWPALAALVAAIVFALTAIAPEAGQAQTLTVLHSFTGGQDGANPEAGLTIDRKGNLYGTTAYGGNKNEYCAATCGAVFRLSRAGSGWVTAPIYDFHGGYPHFDGANPNSRVVFGPDGTLYGTASTPFNLKPAAAACKSAFCPWTETVIDVGCCLEYEGDLTFDGAGNIYGTSLYGGILKDCNGSGCGFVFELTPSSSGWTETDLYDFTGFSDGALPMGGVIFDQSGNLYGTTAGVGDFGNGSVFELTPSGSGWTGNTLYYFKGGSDGKYPVAGVVFDQAGNLYGATSDGGTGGGGTVFELAPSSGNWNFTLLYGLAGSSYEGGPVRNLTIDAAGNLYGTTRADGAYNLGSVFKLTPGNGGWTYTSLHDFTGGSDGAYPESSLTLDSEGNLYGTTYAGGNTGANCDAGYSYHCGVVFEVTPVRQ